MKLQKKTLLIFLTLLLCMTVVTTIVSNNLMTRELSKIEEIEVISQNEKMEILLRSQLYALERTNEDWAYWDDTYWFVTDRNKEYILSNLQDDTLVTLQMNSMIFVNPLNEIVYAKSFDLLEEKEIPVSDELRRIIAEINNNSSEISGFVVLPEGPAFISSKDIQRSTRLGITRGRLIFVRIIEDNDINLLSSINKGPVYIYAEKDLSNNPKWDLISDSLLLKKKPLVVPIDKNVISGYTVLNDIFGNPTVFVRVDTNREIYKIGVLSISYIIIISFIISTVFVIVFFLFVNISILYRLSKLTKEANDITTAFDKSKRLEIGGDDEISLLATNVNMMMDSLEESQKKLKNIIEHTSNLFFSHTPDNVMTYVSPQARDFLDTEPEDALTNWTNFLSDNPINEMGLYYTNKAIETGERQPVYELELKNKKGKNIWVEVYETPIVENGKTVEVVGALVDITERKKALEQIDKNIEYFAHLVDYIRNSLAILSGFIQVKVEDEQTNQKLLNQVDRIEKIIKQLEKGWLDTEDTKRFLNRKEKI